MHELFVGTVDNPAIVFFTGVFAGLLMLYVFSVILAHTEKHTEKHTDKPFDSVASKCPFCGVSLISMNTVLDGKSELFVCGTFVISGTRHDKIVRTEECITKEKANV